MHEQIRTKSTSPGVRHLVLNNKAGLSKEVTIKHLVSGKKRISCRNNLGRVTRENRGGGHKRRYRVIDFKRRFDGLKGTIRAIEYDPNRSARIFAVCYENGLWSYILGVSGMKVGDTLTSGRDAPLRDGNTLPLECIPDGSTIHAVELHPGNGAIIARSAGAYVTLQAKEGKYALLKLRSGEIRKVLLTCRATLGTVCNKEHFHQKLGKAGRNRWKGVKHSVRGVAKNPVDHPMGGGEGRSSGGRQPCSKYGQKAKGLKTRKRKNPLIVKYANRRSGR